MNSYKKPAYVRVFYLRICYNTPMKSYKHILGFLITCIAVGTAIGFVLAWHNNQSTNTPTSSVSQAQDNAASSTTTTSVTTNTASAHLLFVGDIMVDRGVETSVKNNLNGDFGRLFENIGSTLKSADVVFGNLEGPVTTKGPNVGSRFSFAMNQKILPALVNNNFKMVSFANNHVGDRSNSGFADTLTNLDSAGLAYTGAGQNLDETTRPKIITVNGMKIGFIGCTDVGPTWLAATITKPGILLCSNPNLGAIIAAARPAVDFLIFSAHWGVEYHPRTTHQQDLAHLVIDNGADMVIGHHPHVIEATETYKGKFIAYSMGNFIFDQYFSNDTMHGLVVDVVVTTHAITSVNLKIVELKKSGNKYQPKDIRDAQPADFIIDRVVVAQTCPIPAEPKNNPNLWLTPVGPNLDIGNYTPSNLVPMDNRMDVETTANCLIEPAANALQQMVSTMEDHHLSIVMTSGFRSKATQESLKSQDTTNPDSMSTTTNTSVALPGHSEHQLGVAVDLKSKSDPTFSYAAFGKSPEYQWLVANSYKYGFLQSYRAGTESITGYVAEPWHFRYLGVDLATKIHDSGLTTYEYLKNMNK
jgi:poly-gamma-glutamate capsule biosynthesis protein CapA/YwtB (metallophosphatase superfamily)